MVKNLPAVQAGLITGLRRSSGEKVAASSIHLRRNLWTEEPSRLQVHGVTKNSGDWAANTFTFLQSVLCNEIIAYSNKIFHLLTTHLF